MSGYGPAGRGTIIPERIQRLTQRLTQPKEFLYHPSTFWKSIICRIYWEEWTSWGRCWWKWLFSLGKTRFTMVKVIIGRFSNRKWAKPRILPGRDPILSTQRIPRGRDPDFIYTKNKWGRSWRKWQFPLGKTRCALTDFWWGDVDDYIWFFLIAA